MKKHPAIYEDVLRLIGVILLAVYLPMIDYMNHVG